MKTAAKLMLLIIAMFLTYYLAWQTTNQPYHIAPIAYIVYDPKPLLVRSAVIGWSILWAFIGSCYVLVKKGT